MKILIVNPNSDPGMTEAILKIAENFADGEFEVVCKATPGAPDFIETYENIVKASPEMIQLVRNNENINDAFIVACHYDPNLDAIKEITRKPVVGIGEASMKIATMLGHRFSVVTTDKHSIPIHKDLIRKYHLQDVLVSVRSPRDGKIEYCDEEKYMQAAHSAIDEDKAEVIVLGCAGMAGLDRQIEQKLGIPVLDGVVCALIIVTGFLRSGISTSKIKRYNPEH